MSFQNSSFVSGVGSLTSNLTTGYVNQSSFYNTDALSKRYDYQHTQEAYEIQEAGSDASLTKIISNFTRYIEKGQEDKAIKEYNRLLTEMGNQTRYSQLAANGDDTQLRATARTLIENALKNSGEEDSLEDFIVNHTENTFERGFGINWDGDKLTEEDILKEVCDYDETTSMTGVAGVAGHVCKDTLGGAALGAAVGSIVPGIGTAVGAVVGAIGGFVAGLFFGGAEAATR